MEISGSSGVPRRAGAVLGLAVVVTFVAPVPGYADDWAQFRATSTGTSLSSEVSGAAFHSTWTHTAKHGGRIVAAPVIVDGIVVIASTSGDVEALDLATGEARWSQSAAQGVGATPHIAGGRVVVPTLGGHLSSFDLGTGEAGWSVPFGGANYGSPIPVPSAAARGHDFVVAAGFPAQKVHRIDASTGAPRWTSPTLADLSYSSAVIEGGLAVVGMNGGRYQAIDLETGGLKWKYDAPGGMVYLSAPAVADGRVFMFPGDGGNHVFAVELATGTPVAGFPVEIPDPAPVTGFGQLGFGPAVSSPMVAGGLVIVHFRRQTVLDNPNKGAFRVSMREGIAAIDPRLARVVWQREIAAAVAPDVNGVPELNVVSTPAAFSKPGGAALAVSSSISPRVAILDAATGAELWSGELGAPSRSSPVFANGKLLVGTDAGTLHVFTSDVNHPPDGDATSYRVRVARVGVSVSLVEAVTSAGEVTLSMPLDAGHAYRAAVRAVDAKSAMSPWSPVMTFDVPASPAPPLGEPEPDPASPVPADVLAAPATTPSPSSQQSPSGGTMPASTIIGMPSELGGHPAPAAGPSAAPAAAAVPASARSAPTATPVVATTEDPAGGCSISDGDGGLVATCIAEFIAVLAIRRRRKNGRAP